MTDAVVDQPLTPADAQAADPAKDVPWTLYVGFAGMVLGQFMALLDIHIVAGSLTQIQSGIGASADEISWVQTIYLLAEVLTMPLCAYLTKLWGTRPFYMVATAGFIIASIITGLSSSIEMMIVTRAIQGLAAGAMIPPVMAVAWTSFPPERRITLNVITGLVVTLAPAIGPTVGGFLTDQLSWRWLFFVNVPVGFAVIALVGRYGAFDKGDPALKARIDWTGLTLMACFLLSMQYVLEEGARNGWLQDDLLLWLTVFSVVTGAAFIWRQLTYARPIVSLQPFANRNFALAAVIQTMAGLTLYGAIFIMPLFMAQVLGYNASQVGAAMGVAGLTMFVAAPFTSRMARQMDIRLVIVIGFALSAYSTVLGVTINPNWGFWPLATVQVLRALGAMFAGIGAQQMAIATLPISQMKDASGLIYLLRNCGGAIGLALVSTVLSHQTAVHASELSANVNAGSYASQDMMDQLNARMSERGMADPDGGARKAFSRLIVRESKVLGYEDGFLFLTLVTLACLPLPLLARRSPKAFASPPRKAS